LGELIRAYQDGVEIYNSNTRGKAEKLSLSELFASLGREGWELTTTVGSGYMAERYYERHILKRPIE
jgi:hypothetical protein